jgi:hypothetical protein
LTIGCCCWRNAIGVRLAFSLDLLFDDGSPTTPGWIFLYGVDSLELLELSKELTETEDKIFPTLFKAVLNEPIDEFDDDCCEVIENRFVLDDEFDVE